MSKINIVLLEDNDLTRIGLIAALRQVEAIEVVGEASNGLQGLQIVAETNPDLVIVALALPDIDGVEVTQRIKKSPNESQTVSPRVLILTTETSEEDVLAAFVAGADSYLLKDVNFDHLVEAIHMTYEGNSWIDPNIARVVLQKVKQPVRSSIAVSSQPTNEEGNLDEYQQTTEIGCIDNNQEIIDISPLTDRELDVLELIVGGCNNAQIAEKLFITVGTVKTHVRNILNKLCVDDRTQAAVHALRSGLVK